MTTTVTVHVNGRYRATVIQKDASGNAVGTTIVEGNYAGSPNPNGNHQFHLHHPATASFDIAETAVPDDAPNPVA